MRPSKLFHTVVIVGAALAGGCSDDRAVTDSGPPLAQDAGTLIADAAMDAASALPDAGDVLDDAGMADGGEDAMVLIL